MTDKTLNSVPIFAELSEREFDAVHGLMTEIHVDDGRTLTVEGQPGLEFMILVKGAATVDKGGEVIATLGPGDFFGELAVIGGKPRNATVTATEPSVVQVLTRRELMALLDESPTIAKKMLIAIVERLDETDAALRDSTKT